MTGAKPSRLERFGLFRLRARAPIVRRREDEPVHVLSPEEQRALGRIERWAIVRASFAGALGALAGVVANLRAGSFEVDPLRYVLVVGGVTGGATLLELSYLYFDGVRSVRAMAEAAGLSLGEGEIDETIALGLARAAFELPSPPESLLGVHAHQESSKWALAARSLFYKLKVTVTNFLLKALVRRLFGRAAARLYLEAVAIPVAAIWNGLVALWILREARLRIVGATLAEPLLDFVAPEESTCADAALAFGCVTVQAESVHPNVEMLALALEKRFSGMPRGRELGSRARLLERAREASRGARGVLLRATLAAMVVDGTVSRREKRLLAALCEGIGVPVPEGEVLRIARELRHGSGFSVERFAALAQRIEESLGP